MNKEDKLSFLSSIPDIVCIKDGEGRWLWANEAIFRKLGFQHIDYVGKKDSELAELVPFPFRDVLLHGITTDEEAWQKKALNIKEEILELPGGDRSVFETYKIPIFDEGGQRKFLFILARDIVSYKKLVTDLEYKTQEQEVLLHIMSVWQKTSLSLSQKMEEILHILISIPWLSIESKAAWFVAVPERKELRLAAFINFTPEHRDACKRLYYMECLCGRAIEFLKTQYISHADELGAVHCPIQQEHYHYIIPLRFTFNGTEITSDFIGCISLYTSMPHEEHERFCRFFDAVARVVSMGIEVEWISQSLKDRLSELQLATELLNLGIIKYDFFTKVMYWSDTVYEILQLKNHRPSLKNYLKRTSVMDRSRVLQAFRLLMREKRPVDLIHALQFNDSTQRIVHLKLTVINKDNPSIYGILQDITLDVAMQDQLLLLSTILEHSNEAVVVTDKDNLILSVNKAFTSITGYSSEEVIGKSPSILKSGYHDRSFYENMWKSLQTTNHWEGEIWNRHKDGHTYPEWISIYVIRDDNGNPSRHISIFHDITKEKEAKALLQYRENHDTLTGLPNKALFQDRIRTAILQREENSSVAVFVLDIDDFKRVNDMLGYTKGDMIIQDVAVKLSELMPSNVTICRFDGDGFGIVVTCFDERDVLSIVSRIYKIFEEPFGLDHIYLTASVGVSLAPIDGMEPEDLIKKAETAMYAAKKAGKSQHVFFKQELSNYIDRLLKIEKHLRRAIEAEEIALVYQPKVELKSGRIVSVEVLARWNSPELGFVSPAEFIPLAETTKLIGQLSKVIVEKAAIQALEWKKQGYDLTVAFNLSPVQFRTKGVVEDVLTAIKRVGGDLELMEIEITEGAVLDNEEAAIESLMKFKNAGIGIAMDDFGIGYSSLYYLKRLPIDCLKIDMVFIKELPFDKDACAITRAIISMAKVMGLKIIAEGAETQDAVNFLKKHECDMIQGYFFSPPLPPERLIELLEQQKHGHKY